MFKQVFSKQNRALLAELVRTDFKLRYQGSVLGYAWSLLKPLMLFTILYVVFTRFIPLGKGIEHYPIVLLLGLVLWSFFTEMTSQSLSSIVARGDLIRKIRIPRWIIVVSSSISAIINLTLNLMIVAIFMLLNGVELQLSVMWFPLVLLQLYVFALGLSLWLSAAFVKFRDISSLWEVFLQALMYATPIIYPLTLITNETYQKLMLMNPLAQMLQDARYVLVTHDPAIITIDRAFSSSVYRLIPAGFSVLVLVLGVLYFKRRAKYFAEDL